jgi:hypothetical protein
MLKNQHKALFFGMYLTADQWGLFSKWWRDSGEGNIWSNTAIPPGTPGDKVGGHPVTCIGYDDTDPHNRYWIVLNSWGRGGANAQAPGGYNRANGVFHLTMNLDYSANCFFWTIDPEWDEG